MIQLLTYCVYRQKMDPMFQMLGKNYQLQPTADKALALYDQFVASDAPLRLSLDNVDVAGDWLVSQTLEKVRVADRLLGQPIGDTVEDGPVYVRHMPAKNSFDGILGKIAEQSTQISDIEASYKPELDAVANLPGGKLNPVQREFTERIWKPSRTRLSQAGFFMIANVGG